MPRHDVVRGRRRAGRPGRAGVLACALLTGCLLLAGCGSDDASPTAADRSGGAGTGRSGESAAPAAATPGSSTDPSADPSTAPAGTGLDPSLAVDPPGPLQGPLESADLLVNADATLPDDLVKAIRDLDGVASALPVEMAVVPVEGKALNVLAVDPAQYRRYTPSDSANLQEVWDRVARGEVAVPPPDTDDQLLGDGDYLTLGVAADAPKIHVGAYAPQVPFIDAVVNDTWGERLAMKPGNALVISTGIAAPQRVQKQVQRLVGDDVSVQALDVVAQLGLDPSAPQTALLVGTVSEAVGTYRYTVSGGAVTPDPAWVASHISTDTVPILGTVTCNTKLFPQLKAALTEVVERGLADRIHPSEYAGCYYPRFIAGSTRLSNHAFGLALDMNVPGNGRGTVGEMDRGVVAIFKKWGFAWGGDWSYTDPMHFEMAALVNPGK